MKKQTNLLLVAQSINGLSEEDTSFILLVKKLEQKQVEGLIVGKTRSSNKIIKRRLILRYTRTMLLKIKSYERFVYNGLLKELQEFLDDLMVTNKPIELKSILKVYATLQKDSYRAFLKEHISGVKLPKDKIKILADFHKENLLKLV